MNTPNKLVLVGSVLGVAQPFMAMAATVNFTVPSTIEENSGASPFFLDVTPDIVDADGLLSIDGGTVSGFEGSTFTLSARYETGPDEVIHQFSFPFEGSVVTRNLADIPLSSFSAGMLTGLVFSYSHSLDIPAGTVFSFNSNAAPVPEPASAGLWAGLAGAVATVQSLRRPRRDGTASPA